MEFEVVSLDEVRTFPLVQVFMWSFLRRKTVEGVEGRGRKTLKDRRNHFFRLLLKMILVKPSK